MMPVSLREYPAKATAVLYEALARLSDFLAQPESWDAGQSQL